MRTVGVLSEEDAPRIFAQIALVELDTLKHPPLHEVLPSHPCEYAVGGLPLDEVTSDLSPYLPVGGEAVLLVPLALRPERVTLKELPGPAIGAAEWPKQCVGRRNVDRARGPFAIRLGGDRREIVLHR
jgi:hypothetical protein